MFGGVKIQEFLGGLLPCENLLTKALNYFRRHGSRFPLQSFCRKTTYCITPFLHFQLSSVSRAAGTLPVGYVLRCQLKKDLYYLTQNFNLL